MRKLYTFNVSILVFILIYFINPLSVKEENVLATWIWDTSFITSEPDEISNFLQNMNVNTLYLQIDTDISIETYQEFINVMNGLGIKVYALDGSPEWGIWNGNIENQTFLQWFKSYQESSLEEERFHGIHLDIEPYLLSEWITNQEEIIMSYQQMVFELSNEAKLLNVPIGLDLPFWFDEIKYDNLFGQGYLAHWLIEKVDQITIMAYRNEARGKNGIIEISKQEMKWANHLKKKMLIAVETMELPEKHITFHNQSLAVMNGELQKVAKRFKKEAAFHGFAIHHYESWRELGKMDN